MAPRENRSLRTGLLTLLLAGGAACVAQESRPTDGSAGTDARQIFWQRSLGDALSLQAVDRRPILIAVNMDGESASDRISPELYRDPGFVGLTRRCICVAASLYRHNPRDYDDAGRRIPCPRLGEVTCGEHVALEPVLYERYLADSERVAPRHALILADGRKAWDLSLAFDLREVERGLARVLGRGLTARSRPDSAHSRPASTGDWEALASRRDHRGRLALEAAVFDASDVEMTGALDAIGSRGDRGSIGALRVASARLSEGAPETQASLRRAARSLGLEDALGTIVRANLGARERAPGTLGTRSEDVVLGLLAALDGSSGRTRSFLLACGALRSWSGTERALSVAFDETVARSIREAVARRGGVPSLRQVLAAARRVTDADVGQGVPRPGPITDAMIDESTLVSEVAEAEREMRGRRRNDAALLARHGKASLDLGRRRLESDAAEARSRFRLAEESFRHALELGPGTAEIWIERARAAYFRGDFANEAEFGRRAFALARLVEAARLGDNLSVESVVDDGVAVEALRWIGDGDARSVHAWSGLDPVATAGQMVDAARALGTVAISPYADVNDWCALASFYGALGLVDEQMAILREGLVRLPAALEARDLFTATLWNLGRIDLAPAECERIVAAAPWSPDARWYAGQAWRLAAENDRRVDHLDAAIAAYAASRAWFDLAGRLRPGLAADCRAQSALAWIGAGLAFASEGRREDAAARLVEAAKEHADVWVLRDGLGYDTLDLVDRVFEWRASGASAVDPAAFLDRIDVAAPGDHRWALAVSDAELREALRADGRNPERIEGQSVDADGRKVAALVGLPTNEGDRYLDFAIAAARRATGPGAGIEDRKPLAQALTIFAERRLARGRPDGAREALGEAAALLEMEAPTSDASPESWAALARKLRDALGPARPRFRPGR